jgi:hypothetical protein
MTYEEDHWSEVHVPEEEVRLLLEAIGAAVVDGLRTRGLTGVVVRYDDEDGQVHATALFKNFPQSLEEHDAIWGHFSDLTGRFFDEAAVYFHLGEADECADAGYADHVLTLAAA